MRPYKWKRATGNTERQRRLEGSSIWKQFHRWVHISYLYMRVNEHVQEKECRKWEHYSTKPVGEEHTGDWSESYNC